MPRSRKKKGAEFGLGPPVLISDRQAGAIRNGGPSQSPLTGSAGPPALSSPPPRLQRWSGSAWLFARRGSGAQLATGGTLGGSQAGLRATYRLNNDPEPPLAVSARLYAPLEGEGAEAAIGIEWKPVPGLPIRLLAERREALARDARSRFALLAHGGVSDRPLAGPVLLDAYGQAGIVGLRSRDLFADGALSVGVPIAESLRAGGALWGAVQPGAARMDLGPQMMLRIPVHHVNLRLSAEYRFRVAGDAAPRSGPALTLASEF